VDKAYEGKAVFITGTTGFVGSVLLKTMCEKLKGISRIYCLYHSTAPSLADAHDNRVVWIKGDVTLENWGIPEDRLQEIREHVEIIFHLAAYTRWNTTIQEQVHANTLAALHGADLATTCKKLTRYLVASSYWALCNRLESGNIEERIYQDLTAESELSEIVEGGNARLNEWPNAYSYSKNLMERVLHHRYPGLPVMIARITSVTGAWEYPNRGYCDFSISLPAFVRAITQGGVRYFPTSMKSAVNDMIPVDICVNILLANAVDPSNTQFQVIHCSSATRYIPTLGDVAEMTGDVSYYSSQNEYSEMLSNLTEKQAQLNNIIVGAYGFAMANSFIFDDTQARRPLHWMAPETLSRFPIDVDVLVWPSIISSMQKQLFKPADGCSNL